MGFKLVEGKSLREGWDSKELWKSVERQKRLLARHTHEVLADSADIFSGPQVESLATAFQVVKEETIGFLLVYAATRLDTPLVRARLQNVVKLGVSSDCNVCVVCRENELPVVFLPSKCTDDLFVNC